MRPYYLILLVSLFAMYSASAESNDGYSCTAADAELPDEYGDCKTYYTSRGGEYMRINFIDKHADHTEAAIAAAALNSTQWSACYQDGGFEAGNPHIQDGVLNSYTLTIAVPLTKKICDGTIFEASYTAHSVVCDAGAGMYYATAHGWDGDATYHPFVCGTVSCDADTEYWDTNTNQCIELPPQSCPTGGGGGNEPIWKGNPCNISSGAKLQTETDYRDPRDILTFSRTYNSLSGTVGSLGNNWNSPFFSSIRPIGQKNVVLLRLSGGDLVKFNYSQDAWIGGYQNGVQLDLDGDGYQAIFTNGRIDYFDALGQLIRRQNPTGSSLFFSHANGKVESVRDEAGRELQFAYDGERLSTLTAPDGSIYAYTYDALDNLVSVTLPDLTPTVAADNPVRTYHYEDALFPNALTGITDESANRFSTWAYDSNGLARLSEHAGGVDRVEFNIGASSTSVLDTLGSAQSYTFQNIRGRRLLTSIDGDRCENCPDANYSYDVNGFVDTATDWSGHETHFAHDALGQETQRTEAVGTPEQKTITTQWHPTLRKPNQITEPGKRTDFGFNTRGQVLTRTVTDTATNNSRSLTYTYCEAADVANMATTSCAYEGLILSMDGPRTDVSDVTNYRYYTDQTSTHYPGDLHTVTNALGQATEYLAYDGAGRVLQMKDANSVITSMTYHPRGWITSRTTDGQTTTFEYDDVGQLTKLTQPNDAFTRFEYDPAHRMDAIEDNFGNRMEYTLDNAGNRTAEKTYGQGAVLKRELGRVFNQLSELEQLVDSRNYASAYSYDANGNQQTITDANSESSTMAYDALDRLKKTIDPLLGETTYGYDGRDNLVSVTDPRGLTTTYTYDGLDNLTQLQSPDTGTTSYTHDTAGNRTSMTDARGVTVNYQYDVLGRLDLIDYAGTNLDVAFSYDQGANCIGRLSSITDASGTTNYTYDARGNLLSDSRAIDGLTFTTSYEYDNANVLIGTTYPSGKHIGYRRDVAGRVTSMDLTDGGPPLVLVDQITYEPFGPMKAWQLGNGLQINRVHDQDYRIDQLGDPILMRSYGYDPVGNITDIIGSAFTGNYGYDELNRLDTAGTTLSGVAPGPLFNQAPVVLATIVGTQNETAAIPGAPSTPWLTPAMRNITADTFQYALERAEAAPGSVTQPETIGLIAIAPGQASLTDAGGNAISIDAQVTSRVIRGWGNGCTNISLGSVFSSPPIVVAQQASHFGGDGGWVRRCAITANAIELTIDEDQYRDNERNHTTEAASVVAFSQSFASTEVAMEAGEIALPATTSGSNAFHQVTFQQNYSQPPVVVALTSNDGGEPAALRVRNVTATGFDIVQLEPSNLDGAHEAMTVHYWAVEPGAHELADGTRLLAANSQSQAVQHGGGVSGAESWDTYTFGLFNQSAQTTTQQSFAYDAVGNRLSLNQTVGTASPAITTYDYASNSNQLTAVDGLARQRDAVGNLLDNGVHQFTYDDRNRMVGVTGSATYELNGRGERVKKTVGSVVTYFVYGQGGQLIGEYGASGAAIKEYVYLNGQPIALLDGTDVNYVHTDHLGTPRAVSDSSGTVVWRWDSTPFGETAANEDPDGDGQAYVYNQRFPGQYYDGETGLHYNYFRDYDAETGRYVESDPIGLDGGINTFGYALLNTLSYFDEDGLMPDDEPRGGHRGNRRESNRERHEGGDRRRQTDQGGERGDNRRRAPRRRPPGHRGPWPRSPALVPGLMWEILLDACARGELSGPWCPPKPEPWQCKA